jgi:hypothetical protein
VWKYTINGRSPCALSLYGAEAEAQMERRAELLPFGAYWDATPLPPPASVGVGTRGSGSGSCSGAGGQGRWRIPLTLQSLPASWQHAATAAGSAAVQRVNWPATAADALALAAEAQAARTTTPRSAPSRVLEIEMAPPSPHGNWVVDWREPPVTSAGPMEPTPVTSSSAFRCHLARTLVSIRAAADLRERAGLVVSSLGGEGRFHALHLRAEADWLRHIHADDAAVPPSERPREWLAERAEEEARGAAAALDAALPAAAVLPLSKSPPPVPLVPLYIAGGVACDHASLEPLRQLGRRRGLTLRCLGNGGPDGGGSYRRAAVEQAVVARAALFVGRAGSSFSWLVAQRRALARITDGVADDDTDGGEVEVEVEAEAAQPPSATMRGGGGGAAAAEQQQQASSRPQHNRSECWSTQWYRAEPLSPRDRGLWGGFEAFDLNFGYPSFAELLAACEDQEQERAGAGEGGVTKPQSEGVWV